MQAEPSDCLIGIHYRGSTPEKSLQTTCGFPAAGGDGHDCMQESGHVVRQREFEAGK
ncbi:hypothetical protein M7I_6532 [Glarea lozoyensis 74030]|uniref:Uncharacterized protein n=1 Tax=Glarea lozoyensis (strain ATCC 74030 / MF5533) TaxID=1104152 RepID=H0EUU3_GLAL7|nr:hypothetical protein M7I_6532 [Glarea lozoyensis 74030]